MNKQKPVNESKLVFLIKTLSGKEIKSLERYLASSFFNYPEPTLQLFLLLKKHHPQFSKEITKEQLFSALFPGEKVRKGQELSNSQDKKLRYSMNYLLNAVQDYLVYQERQKDAIGFQNTLAQIFMQRGLHKFIPAVLKAAKKMQQKQRHKDPNFYYQQFLLEESEFHYNLVTNNRSKDVGAQNLINRFHHYYLVNQLRFFCAAVNRENILQVSYDYPMLEELLQHLKRNDYSGEPLISAYYFILLMLRGEEPQSNYQQLKVLMLANREAFPIEELRQLHLFMLNYCNARIKEGLSHFKEEKHAIYLESLAAKVWNLGKYFMVEIFILVVKNALALSHFTWVASFIEQHGPHLPPNKQEQLTHLAKAHLDFYQKNYTSAHQHLMNVGPSDDVFYELYYRMLMIRLYFEESFEKSTDAYEGPISSALEALRFYISPTRNANLSENNRLAYANFVNLAKRLYRLHFSGEKNKPHQTERLQADIRQTPVLEEREWLLIMTGGE